ncbi:putative gibberellin-regulated protein 11-like [Sesbania bispinosa]|nr:putative gibberellin-regulated protein 11-like [Sesbania bispinosa]
MEKKMMALKSLLVMAALLCCMAKVSSADSNVKIQDHLTNSEVVKGPNRRLLPFVGCTQGQRFASELVGHAVQGAGVFLQALTGTEKCVGGVTLT